MVYSTPYCAVHRPNTSGSTCMDCGASLWVSMWSGVRDDPTTWNVTVFPFVEK